MYRGVFRTSAPSAPAALLVDGTARAATEAALVSLLRPGDRVLVPIFGRFGHLLREIAERCGAEVHTIETAWGTVFDDRTLERAVDEVRPRLVAIVHGDTSTTMLQPLDGLGRMCREHGVLLYADATASLGGNEFDMDGWDVDVATAGLQKCLGGPPGIAPLALSARAVDAVESRRSIEAGLDGPRLDASRRIASNYFDLAMILDYWGEARLNHHTEATPMLYAAHECARLLLDEGMAAAVERHRVHGAAMLAGLRALGLGIFGDPGHRMSNIVAAEVPAGVDEAAVRDALREDFAIEIATSFGPLSGRVWRIGVMGYNARRDTVLTTLAALEHVLRPAGAQVAGSGVEAARDCYAS